MTKSQIQGPVLERDSFGIGPEDLMISIVPGFPHETPKRYLMQSPIS